MKKENRGTLFVVLAALLYSLGGLGIKLIPWNGIAINGARGLVALMVVSGYLLMTRHRIYLDKWVALGAVAVCGANLLFCIANKLTTAANAIVLQFTAPVFVILMAFLFWKKRPTKMEVATCGLVFFGVLFFFWDSLSTGGNLGNFIAILSGISYAGVFFLNRMLGKDSILAVFWGYVLSVAIGIPFLFLETDFSLLPVMSAVILGVFQTGLAFVFLMAGLRTVQPVTACLVSGLEPVLNPVLVAIFYHETIGILSMIGAVIVVGSIVGYNVLLTKNPGV